MLKADDTEFPPLHCPQPAGRCLFAEPHLVSYLSHFQMITHFFLILYHFATALYKEIDFYFF